MSTNESNACPICGAINLLWDDLVDLLESRGLPADHDQDIHMIDGERYTNGTACWDSAFGDYCGACKRTILNSETSLIGAMGYCHE